MQSNVQLIKQAAEATGQFEVVSSRSLLDNRQYPAFCIGDRSVERQAMDGGHRRYLEPWRYSCYIMHLWDKKQSDDWNFEQLESLSVAFLGQVVSRGAAIIEESQGEAVLSGKEIIIAEITVEFDSRNSYE